MDSQTNGPDGSSIKPVSSLRAQFENLNKIDEHPSRPPVRTVSPAPKPDRIHDAAPVSSSNHGSTNPREPPVLPESRPKRNLNVASLKPPSVAENNPFAPGRPILPPPLSPRPIHPPSLMVEPPQSPPKPRPASLAIGDDSNFLNPDTVLKPSSPAGAARPFKIPSRPHTPSLEPRRSPRLNSPQPPSPPPPRRSAELRRERDSRPSAPPVNRAEKPLIPSRSSYISEGSQVVDLKSRIAQEVSPFNSPPSSNSTAEDDAPPVLPARPRVQPPVELPTKSKTIQLTFEPPPVHHAVANMRKGRDLEANGGARGPMSPQVTGEQRPALPARPQTTAELQPNRNGPVSMAPPPRPPRPGLNTSNSALEGPSSAAQKRVVSSPTTQFAPPPTRTALGRSMTVDRASGRAPQESRAPPAAPTGMGDSQAQNPAPSASTKQESGPPVTTAYPDPSNTNRRPPYIKQGVYEIFTKYDPRTFDVCGELVCTSGQLTRAWSLLDGEMLMSLAHGEGIRGTSIAFKPGADVSDEGARVWIGNNFGELIDVDIATQSIVASKVNVHGRYEVIKIYRHFRDLWTLDDGGTLHVWGPDEDGVPSLASGPHQSHRIPRGHTFSIVVGDELWHATGKEIRVFLPTVDGRAQFQVLIRPLCQDGAGEVSAGTLLTTNPDRVLFGHVDGKVTIYSAKDYLCLAVLNVTSYKINSLASTGQNVWAGYNNGKVSVYEMSQTPWTLRKEWQAHESPVVKIIADRSSCYKLGRGQVLSLGADNMVRSWDGLLQEDWLESEMKARDAEYCDFEQVRALVMTWNAGASTPNSLRYSDSDATFIQDLLQNSGSPDILVFGFQELVDLEDKTATAKRLLKPKKKEGSDNEHMSHQYRDWRDFLVRSLDDYMPNVLYHLLHTATLVGLFTCIFVKADLRDRISNLSAAEVKRGMGGLHGNKGAIVVRFTIDDSSLCFINCHLAAGQSQASHRHNDIAAILEAAILPVERDPAARMDLYTCGGDGTTVLDHELCLLNGDLNYRIDTMSRDTVVMAVRAGNLAKLLERDQLLVARRRNPAFRLRAFDEMPIAFAPTYKYDVGSDVYDSSEKRRSPAWCDRLLYRGGPAGRVEQLDYRRHEVRVSDHRPVTGRFKLTVKRIERIRRAAAWAECLRRWEDVRDREAGDEKLYYLTEVCGYDEAMSRKLIRDRAARRDHRSPSRHREETGAGR